LQNSIFVSEKKSQPGVEMVHRLWGEAIKCRSTFLYQFSQQILAVHSNKINFFRDIPNN